MWLRPPAVVGCLLADVLTPCLLISMPAFEANEAAMRAKFRGSGVMLRPHAKAHKSSGLARYLLERGGHEMSGLCAQTVTEAEVLVRDGGCLDVLLTNELAAPAARRLARLAADHPAVRISALVDHPAHVAALSEAASAAGAHLHALVEINCGQDRCGVPPASDLALDLARAINEAEALSFGGLQVYHGAIQHVRDAADRRARVEAGPAAAARSTVARFALEGIEVRAALYSSRDLYSRDLYSRDE